MPTRFTKMHGCGNDFVILDERTNALALSPARIAALANRRTGIGCDQLITVAAPPPASDALAFLRFFNPDGSEAGACGNGTRCAAALLLPETGRTQITLRTIAGDLPVTLDQAGRITVDMGTPRLDWPGIPLAKPADTLHLDIHEGPVSDPAVASMGNPHATFFVDDLSAVSIDQLGPCLEHHPIFPQRANIGFAQILAPDRIRLRVWERGAGLTLACGSGACAALVNAHRRGLTGRHATIHTDGGDLTIVWRDDGHVLMTGPVAIAFTGEVDLSAYPA